MKQSGRSRNYRRAEEWRELLKEQSSSGQSVKEYCESRGLRQSSFHRWRKLGAKTGEATNFVELGVIESKSCWEVEVLLPSGVVLRAR